MNIFLVGNGLDLHHKFPTNYLDFLDTIQYLIDHKGDDFDTVGKIFGSQILRAQNSFIDACYEKHAGIYDLTALPKEELNAILMKAEGNLWFKYLRDCVSKDIRWIDFEREILRVLEAFSAFFMSEKHLYLSEGKIHFDFAAIPDDPEDRHILSRFGFFYEEANKSRIGIMKMMRIKQDFMIEKVAGSGTYYLAADKIVSYLYGSLRDLADLLRWYLRLFVDAPAETSAKLEIKVRWPSMPTANYVYSFNYTNTLEILYSNYMIDHIHGNTQTNIVLGVNPDENDIQGNTDTTFLQFKKYFQRVFYGTDLSFINKIRATCTTPGYQECTLYVIGHSLDATDEDVIKQIFETARSIIILYHNESSVKNQIRNLVEMYGKEGLDMLRDKKKLIFLPQAEIEWLLPT